MAVWMFVVASVSLGFVIAAFLCPILLVVLVIKDAVNARKGLADAEFTRRQVRYGKMLHTRRK